jgi:hypothetical protein
MEQRKANEIMAIPGNVIGESIRTDFAYIKNRAGVAGVEKIEQALKDLGYPFSSKEIKPLNWYPEAYSVLIYLLCLEQLGWEEKDIFEMGRTVPPLSIIVVKLLLKYLVSVDRLVRQAQRYWRKYYDFGEVEIYDLEKNSFRARIVGYNFHPIACVYQRGYLLGIISLVISSPKLTIEEIGCTHQGHPYHEYSIKW